MVGKRQALWSAFVQAKSNPATSIRMEVALIMQARAAFRGNGSSVASFKALALIDLECCAQDEGNDRTPETKSRVPDLRGVDERSLHVAEITLRSNGRHFEISKGTMRLAQDDSTILITER